MSDFIKWCACKRRLLTTRQQNENKPCALCQQEHAERFKDRLDKLISKEEFNG